MFPIQLTTKNLELTKDLKKLTFEKLKKLEKYFLNLSSDSVLATVLLKKRVHQSEDNIFTTKIALKVPSGICHAHQEGYTLEESLIGAIEDIEDQLERHEGKFH